MKIAASQHNLVPITLHFENASALAVPEQSDFDRWASCALRSSNDAELCIRIVSADESAQLNQQYRNKSGATNVLSFPAELPEDVTSELLGDLAICAEVVFDEARAQGKTASDHWAHMVIHGCLHLLGYDHQDEAPAEQMEQLEIELLADLGIANPYNEPAENNPAQGQ